MQAQTVETIREATDRLSHEAVQRYHVRYDNGLYRQATAHRSTRRANQLLDTAMALCGDPMFTVRQSNIWSPAEEAFLRKFTEPA